MSDITAGVAYQCRRGVVRLVLAIDHGPIVVYRVLAHFQPEKVGREGRIQLYGFARSLAKRVWSPHPVFGVVQDHAAELEPGQSVDVRDIHLEGVQGLDLVPRARIERQADGGWQMTLHAHDGAVDVLRLLFSGALVSHVRQHTEEVLDAARNEPRGRRRRG